MQKVLKYGTTQTLLGGIMNKIVNLVDKSFVKSTGLNDKMAKVLEMRTRFVSGLSDEQCIEFLKIVVEVEELVKQQTEEYIIHTYKVCKDVFKLR